MTDERASGNPKPDQHPLKPTQHDAESLLASDNFDLHADYDPERERQVLAEIEAERAGQGGAPTGLLALMLAPLLLVALPLMLLWFLRGNPATNPVVSGQSPSTQSSSQSASQSASPIVWQTSLDDALALAKQSGKPLMVDFYADWCPPCKMLDQETWPDPAVAQEAQNVISVKVDVDANPNAARNYRIGPIPTILWLDSNGGEKGRVSGFVGPQEMLGLMQQYR